ncbi:TPA: hypothetical protein ACPSKE_002834 [Legionella feeleii]
MDDQDSIKVSTRSTGFFTPTYANRNMKIYAIPENELEVLGAMNTESTMFFSAFSFFISLSLTLFLSGIYADNLKANRVGSFIFYYCTPITTVISLFFLGLGIYIQRKRNNMINIIKKESV